MCCRQHKSDNMVDVSKRKFDPGAYHGVEEFIHGMPTTTTREWELLRFMLWAFVEECERETPQHEVLRAARAHESIPPEVVAVLEENEDDVQKAQQLWKSHVLFCGTRMHRG